METTFNNKLELNKDGFVKYNSIENHYNVKYLNKIPQEIKDGAWISMEKLDGANISLYFRPNEPMKVGKRSGWIQGVDAHHETAENFFDVWNVLKKYETETKYFQALANSTGQTIRLYGELYGSGVQKRCNYGPEKYIKIFDLAIDEVLQSPRKYAEFCMTHEEPTNTFFADFTYHLNLMEALQIDVEKDNYEGVVLKPFRDTVYLYGNDRLIIKKKSIKFSDIAEDKISGKLKNFNPEHVALSEEFKRYITPNRMLDLFSKHGPITDIKQMGTYIKLFLEDAKEDYLKTHSIEGLDQDTTKAIFNIGSMAANMLRDHLKSDAKI